MWYIYLKRLGSLLVVEKGALIIRIGFGGYIKLYNYTQAPPPKPVLIIKAPTSLANSLHSHGLKAAQDAPNPKARLLAKLRKLASLMLKP